MTTNFKNMRVTSSRAFDSGWLHARLEAVYGRPVAKRSRVGRDALLRLNAPKTVAADGDRSAIGNDCVSEDEDDGGDPDPDPEPAWRSQELPRAARSDSTEVRVEVAA